MGQIWLRSPKDCFETPLKDRIEFTEFISGLSVVYIVSLAAVFWMGSVA